MIVNNTNFSIWIVTFVTKKCSTLMGYCPLMIRLAFGQVNSTLVITVDGYVSRLLRLSHIRLSIRIGFMLNMNELDYGESTCWA